MPAQLPSLDIPCCPDPSLITDLVRNSVRRHTVAFDQNCSQVLGCNMTPDVMAEVNKLVGALGSGFEQNIRTIATALPTVGIDRILTAVDSAVGAAENAANEVIGQLTSEVNAVVNDINEQIQSVENEIRGYTAEQLAALNQEIAEAQQAVNQAIQDVVGAVNQELNTVANTISSAITNTVNDILPRAEIENLNRTISQVIKCPV